MGVRIETNTEPLPGYRLIDKLGGGGFGEVWKAEAPGGFLKAIKFVFGDISSGSDSDQRAKQELRALERVRTVRHPYILNLERYEIINGQLIIVMELADRNLWDRYRECRQQGLPGIPREELMRYMAEIAEALDMMYAEHQLQHLDIKPQNLFLIHNHIKVADFGLVKDLEGSQASITGGITPVYAAPETFDGRVTRYSDQYSLAIVYQELLTGQRPYNGSNVRQLILQHISGVPNTSPLPEQDRPIILRSLSKFPEQRYETCGEMVRALQGSGHESAAAPTPTTPPVQDKGSKSSTTMPPRQIPTILENIDNLAPSDSVLLKTASIRRGPPETRPTQGSTPTLEPPAPTEEPAVQPAEPIKAPDEVKGPGTLFPSLIVALGQTGLTMVQGLRERLRDEVAHPANLPHLRFLVLDTDPEILRQASRGAPEARMNSNELLVAPLNRPSHYLKPRENRPNLDGWLKPRMIYRIPRSLLTTGIRSLGRLALVDNYRTISRRLRADLESILKPSSLEESVRATGLGLRSNRPRVYLLASLGGGTGGGMFLDLAYMLRAELKRMGYDNPEIVAVLYLPSVDPSRTQVTSLANCYASLKELLHYSQTGTKFSAKYQTKEAGIEDSAPPFSRVLLQKLPEEGQETPFQELVESTADLLLLELTKPAGSALDQLRASSSAKATKRPGQSFLSFNLFKFFCPRDQLQRAIANSLCQKLVQRWASRDPKPVRERAEKWVQDKWVILELDAECFIHRMQADLTKQLGRPADALFSEVISPLVNAPPYETIKPSSRSQVEVQLADPALFDSVMEQIEITLGRPKDEATGESVPPLLTFLQGISSRLSQDWSNRLAVLSVQLIEEPAFRLVGAEEAIRQFLALIEKVLQHYEPLAKDLNDRIQLTWNRLRAMQTSPKPGSPRPAIVHTEAIEQLRSYSKNRYQLLIVHHLITTFLSLRGHLSDELREVNLCRVRLGDLAKLFEADSAVLQAANHALMKRLTMDGHHNKRIFYFSGCHFFSEAITVCSGAFSESHVLELDNRIEAMLQKNFTALVNVCLTNANILRDVKDSMMSLSQEFVKETLSQDSVCAMFLSEFSDPAAAREEIQTAFKDASPDPPLDPSQAIQAGAEQRCILILTEDDDGKTFQQLFRQALPGVDFKPSPSNDDIVILRELDNLPVEQVEQMGPVGLNAYLQMSSAENLTPHSRSDVDFQNG
ncbi:MAG: tubulin-like doman-containing protein [Gemmataceae bacterium]